MLIFRLLILPACLLPALGRAATKYWIGPDGGAFSTNAHWSTTAGSSQGVNANTNAPNNNDTAVFAADCTTSAVISRSERVAGISLAAGYTGTVTQGAGVTLTLGSSGYAQAAGMFVGGNSDLTVDGPFALSGGTFTSTSGTLTATGAWSVTGGTFNPNNGTVQFFTGNSQSLTLTGSHALNHVTIGGNYHSDVLTIAGGTTLTVNGTLNLAGSNTGNPVTVNGGTIAALGNIVQGSAGATGTTALVIAGTGAQTLTGGGAAAYLLPLTINKSSGTLTLAGTITTSANWTYTAGTLDAGTSTLRFFTGNSQSCTLTGSHALNHVTIGGNYYSDVLTFAGGTTLTVNGTLNLAGSYAGYPVTVNGGTIAALGNIVQGSAGAAGTTALVIAGTGAQTWTSSGGQIPGSTVTVNKATGTVSLGSNVSVSAPSQNLTVTAGTLALAGRTLTVNNAFTVAGAGTLQLHGSESVVAASKSLQAGSTVTYTGDGDSAADSYTLSTLATTYSNLRIASTDGVTDAYALGANVQVNGTLTFTSGNINTGAYTVIVPSSGSVVRTSGHVVGRLQKHVAAGTGVTLGFEVGDVSTYSPVTVTFATVTSPGTLTATTTLGDHPNLASSGLVTTKSVNRYWTLTNGGVAFSSYDGTFSFDAGDLDVGTVTAALVARNYSGGWSALTTGLQSPTSTQATGLVTFGDFALGELPGQTITFGPLSARTFGEAPFAVSATASSGLTPTFSIVSGPATIAGSTVTLTGAGTVVVRASQAGNVNFTAAPSVDQSFDVAKATAVVTLGNLSATYDGTPKSASAVTASPGGLTVDLTYNGSSAAPSAAGSYSVLGTINNGNYQGSSTGTLVIGKASQIVTFGPPAASEIGTPVTLSATASSGRPVSFSLVNGNATLSGATLTLNDTQPVIVRASQAGDANHNPASVERTLTARSTSAALDLRGLDAVYDGQPKFVSVVTNPVGLKVNVTYNGSTVAPTDAGTYPVSALIDESGFQGSATGVLTIAQAAQTISFAPPTGLTPGQAKALDATASSKLPVSYRVVSGRATVASDKLTVFDLNPVVVRALQAGNANFTAAPPVDQVVRAAGSSIYLGGFGPDGQGGHLAAYLTYDASGREQGLLLGVIPATGEGFVLPFAPDAAGSVAVTGKTFAPTTASAETRIARTGQANEPLAVGQDRTFRGSCADGVLTGTIDGLNLVFRASLQPSTGSTARFAGYYQASLLNSASGELHTVVNAEGQVYQLVIAPDLVGDTLGPIGTDGTFSLTADRATITGSLDASTTSITGTLHLSGRLGLSFRGLNSATPRTDRLVNLSSRGLLTSADGLVITGFVLGGTQPRDVLVRAVGPGLAALGVSGVLNDPYLQLFRGPNLVAENDDWGADAKATQVTAISAGVGAFGLSSGSQDSTLLASLQPGAYTVHVSGRGEGVALAEVYDVSVNRASEYQRVINISARGPVGTGDNVLVSGFIISGNAPKKVMIRAVGPALSSHGVSGTLADPVLRLYGGATILARNDNWETPDPVNSVQISASAAEVSETARRTGAFALSQGSKDAALVAMLAPGAYTAVVAGADEATGVALVEIYEVP